MISALKKHILNVQVNMLNTQYRMHPAISRFPSENFYDGQKLRTKDVGM